MPQVALGGEIGGAAGGAIGGLFGKKGKKIGRKVGKIAGKVLGHFGFQEGGRVRRPPVKAAVMPYKHGGAVRAFNKRPRHMVNGGSVISHPLMSKKQRAEDSVRAILQPGELVVPVKHYQKGRKPVNLADMTVKAFKAQGIKLPGMK